MSNPLTTFAKWVLSIVLSEIEANATYARLLPALKFVLEKKGKDSPEAIGLFQILEQLPPSGIKRISFKNEYIEKPDGWKDLPDDPDNIPFGYWHP